MKFSLQVREQVDELATHHDDAELYLHVVESVRFVVEKLHYIGLHMPLVCM